ncbi:hypothetical protein PIB30_100139, partial [Stylosanthes scabra]|nr:hypothetical protein [Stylosanthes scabra]
MIVDLSRRSIVETKVYKGHGYPMLNIQEEAVASALPFSYGPFKESLKKRSLHISEVVCSDYTVCWFGEKKTKRLLKISANFYMRPLGVVEATVDLDEMKIVDYKDRYMVPMPKAEGTEYRASKLKPPFGPNVKGFALMKHDGPAFKLDGNTASWANSEFHVGFDNRAGPIISLASVYDLEMQKYRRVLYRGFISELFVPYQDPSEESYSYFDSGEFGFGESESSLEPLKDCPSNAHFLDAFYADANAKPVKITNAFCKFEKYAGDIMWRHTEVEIPNQVITEVRPDVTLVRTVSTLGNYDYIIDWEFKPSGSINLR